MIKRVLFALLIVSFSATTLANFVVSPTEVEASVKTKVISYTLENKTNYRSAYDIQVFERQLLPNGEEVLLDTKELRAFPSKVIVEPGKKKRIKVMYLGKRNISSEKPYRVNFIQTDKDVSEDQKNQIDVRFEFFTSLYIQPKDISSQIETDIVKRDGKWLLHLRNSGTKHHILNDWKLSLSGSGSDVIKMPPVNLLADTYVYLAIESEQSNLSADDISIVSP